MQCGKRTISPIVMNESDEKDRNSAENCASRNSKSIQCDSAT